MRNHNSPNSLRQTSAKTALLASVLGSAFLPAVAHADEPPAAGPEIVVNGERAADANPNADAAAPYKVDKSADGRFTEALRDTPKSITVIPKEVIEDQGATSFRELARTTPGVTLGTGEGGNAFGDRIFIRGFEARTTSISTASAIPECRAARSSRSSRSRSSRGPRRPTSDVAPQVARSGSNPRRRRPATISPSAN